MLEELRETVLTDLEQRVERAIDLIEQLKQDKLTLESQISELHEQIQQKDAQIESLETRNAELQYAESELATLRVEREQEREDIDLEKAELRNRIEGVMKLLNGTEDRPETSLEHPAAAEGELTATTSGASFVEDEPTETSGSPVNEESAATPEPSLDPDTAAAEETGATAGEDELTTESSELSFADDESTEPPESQDTDSTAAPESSLDPDTPVTEDVQSETERRTINTPWE